MRSRIHFHSAWRDPHRGSCREEPVRIDDAWCILGPSESGCKGPISIQNRVNLDLIIRLACGIQGTSVFALNVMYYIDINVYIHIILQLQL